MFALQFPAGSVSHDSKNLAQGIVGLLIAITAQGHDSCSLRWPGRTRAGGAAMQELKMLYYALVFLIVGVIAGALGVAGVASVASQIAWVLFVIGIVLLLVSLITGRRTTV